MPAGSRLTISTIGPDPRANAITAAAEAIGLQLPGPVTVSDVAFVDGAFSGDDLDRLGAFLADPLLQNATWDEPADDELAYEIAFSTQGVTDASADAIAQASRQLGLAVSGSATGRRVVFPAGSDDVTIDALLRRVIANPVIEHWSQHRIDPVFNPGSTATGTATVIPVREFDDAELAALNAERSMALDPAELLAIRDQFRAERRDPTDVELETLAQTWSEHCAHKTFRARITLMSGSGMSESGVQGTEIAPLLRQLRDHRPDRRQVRPLGIRRQRRHRLVRRRRVARAQGRDAQPPVGGRTLRRGQHGRRWRHPRRHGNRTSPGGRDRHPLLRPGERAPADVPDGTLHPRRIRQGVVDGVADYGNKIGLPTVAGAVLYDPDYTANPLVFCGCVGVADDWEPARGPFPGDRVVVLGGRTGRDGIRGATFSSAEMDASTGEVAGASVQIGDPVTEKLLIDVLDGAEHLWTAITDCGAGGLSSAVGEMAEVLGADVELDAVPLKYPGLEPWEIWLSEAQERMVVAVPPDAADEFIARCDRHRVDYADIGEFTGDGRLVVRSGGVAVLDLDTTFLHDGRPTRSMTAIEPAPTPEWTSRNVHDPGVTLLELLAHPNIASKAAIVHRYDHEIGGATLVRPLTGAADVGHADGVVMAHPEDEYGFAIGIGVNPWYGLHDPKAMAEVAIDEAVRNVVAVGADPDLISLLDNFSWGDPRDPATLGELAAAVVGCCNAATAFSAPFVSGKDSLNNTYVGRDGQRHAVPPTLVITAVAHVPDAEACITPELRSAGNVLLLVGETGADFAGSHLDLLTGAHRTASPEAGRTPQFDPESPGRYRGLHRAIRRGFVQSCHDVSEGGLAVAIAEMCIASGLGASIDSLPHDDITTALFSESAGRLVLELAEFDVDAVVGLVGGGQRIGVVTADPVLDISGVATIEVDRLRAAFHGEDW